MLFSLPVNIDLSDERPSSEDEQADGSTRVSLLKMPPNSSVFTALNLPSESLQITHYFTLSADPNTHLSRTSQNEDILTAPMAFTSLSSRLVVAEVNISGDWAKEGDQGGLIIFDTSSRRWVKAGIEFSSNDINALTVSATSDGADWCSFPVEIPHLPPSFKSMGVKLERVDDSLCIWYQPPHLPMVEPTPRQVRSTWEKLREISRFFNGVEDKSIRVGVYASRPTRSGIDELVVEFQDFKIL
jgi:regulation of enolase protein 1 (concanavalin A-like superfamily)